MKEEVTYLTITQFTERLKAKFDFDSELQNVYLHGELSNFRIYPSGHAYFSLKDEGALIAGVMWGSNVKRLSFRPKDGDDVLLHGAVSIYPSRGSYQVYADHMELFGEGAALLRLKELAKKLQAEGLFDEARKRPLPKFPKTIGLITAKGSAAIKDMVHNLQIRWPLADILVFPSLVQGKEAPASLLKAFQLSQKAPIDVLIIGRGGGSSEDLDAFNDETLVRALASSKCPTISAVGHEIDVTLCDYVADKRVSTPTGAAVAAVPDKREIALAIDGAREALIEDLESRLSLLKQKYLSLASRPFFQYPQAIYSDKLEDLQRLKQRLALGMNHQEKAKKGDLERVSGRLQALSPFGVLSRGYSITEDQSGKIVSSIDQVEPGQDIKTHLKDGIIFSCIEKKEAKEHE